MSEIESQTREAVNREMGHIDVLAGEIGFRVATTEGERRAASYIEREMGRYGLREVRQEAFPCTSEAMNRIFPYFLTMLGSSLLAPLAPLAGLLGLVATPLTMMGELRLRKGPVTRLTRTGESHNVIGVLPAKGERKAHVVLMAHYDSVRVRGYMKPSQGKSPRRLLMPLLGLSYVAAIGAAVTGVVARLRGKRGLARTARRVSGLAGAGLLAGTSPLLAGQLMPSIDGEGANDNASGVAVLLSLAEEMATQPLEQTEVWFVATGAEETGLNGAHALLERHGDELRDAYFFAIDTVGAGRLHYTIQERGMRGALKVPHEVVDILVKASERGQHGALPYTLGAGGTDAGAALGKRYKAASISALIKDGKWPEINWPTDVRRYVEPEALPEASAFVRDILYEIDDRVCYNNRR